nr:T9SS type A sorting domain-containing protein [Bacteroidota bacterium]
MKKTSVLLLSLLLRVSLVSQPFQIEWQGCFGGSDSDAANDIAMLNNGYLIAGSTLSNDGDIGYLHGGQDWWIINTDFTGNLIWEKTLGGSNGDYLLRIIPDLSNNYYLLGSSYSSDGDITNDPYPESTDFWIVKIDRLGNILWDRILGGNVLDQMWAGTLTSDGGVLAYGWTGSPDGDVSVSYGAYDMWMVKVNSDGEKEWDFSIGTDWFDYGQAVIETSDGGFLCGGSSMIGEGGNLTCEPFNYSHAEAILVKLDKDRNIEWQNCYGGSGHEGVWSLLELNDGYIFTGLGDSNDGDLTGSGCHGDGDVWVVKIDFGGNIIWQKCFGGSKYEYSPNIFQSSDGGFSIIGMTQSEDGDVFGNHSLQDRNDIWMIKVSTNGELLSQQCIGGMVDEKVNFGVIKKSDYNFVIAGETNWGPSYDVQCTPHNQQVPYDDFWVLEVKDTITGITNNQHQEIEIELYPNPAGQWIVVDFKLPLGNYNGEISLIDVTGKIILSEKIYGNENQKVLDIAYVTPGLYFYTITSGGIIKRGKIVVK